MALATRTCRQAAIISALAVSIACSRDPAPAPPAPVTSQDTFTLAMVSDPHRTLLGLRCNASEICIQISDRNRISTSVRDRSEGFGRWSNRLQTICDGR